MTSSTNVNPALSFTNLCMIMEEIVSLNNNSVNRYCDNVFVRASVQNSGEIYSLFDLAIKSIENFNNEDPASLDRERWETLQTNAKKVHDLCFSYNLGAGFVGGLFETFATRYKELEKLINMKLVEIRIQENTDITVKFLSDPFNTGKTDTLRKTIESYRKQYKNITPVVEELDQKVASLITRKIKDLAETSFNPKTNKILAESNDERILDKIIIVFKEQFPNEYKTLQVPHHCFLFNSGDKTCYVNRTLIPKVLSSDNAWNMSSPPNDIIVDEKTAWFLESYLEKITDENASDIQPSHISKLLSKTTEEEKTTRLYHLLQIRAKYFPNDVSLESNLLEDRLKIIISEKSSQTISTVAQYRREFKLSENQFPSIWGSCVSYFSKRGIKNWYLNLSYQDELSDKSLQVIANDANEDKGSLGALSLYDASFKEGKITKKGLQEIGKKNPLLHALNLGSPSLTDDVLSCIFQSFRKITHLNINNSKKITDTTLKDIIANYSDQLTCLEIEGCSGFSDEAINELGKCKKLDRLNLIETEVLYGTVHNILKKVNSLTELCLSENNYITKKKYEDLYKEFSNTSITLKEFFSRQN